MTHRGILVVVLLALALTACTQPTVTPSATPAPTPDFIAFIGPIQTDQESYNHSVSQVPMARGIVVMINNTKMDLAPENYDGEILMQRASLFVDDEQVLQDTLMIADGAVGLGGPYYLSWAPPLELGTHEVQFQFLTDSGEILEYTWQMVIVK